VDANTNWTKRSAIIPYLSIVSIGYNGLLDTSWLSQLALILLEMGNVRPWSYPSSKGDITFRDDLICLGWVWLNLRWNERTFGFSELFASTCSSLDTPSPSDTPYEGRKRFRLVRGGIGICLNSLGMNLIDDFIMNGLPRSWWEDLRIGHSPQVHMDRVSRIAEASI